METETHTVTPSDDGMSFAELFEESLQQQREVKEGEVVQGNVIEIAIDSVLVDIGYKSEATVSLSEFRIVEGAREVQVGDQIDVFVESREDDSGLVIVSKEKADKLRVWDDISGAAERDELVEGTIIARVKGGLSVDIGVKAFLPGSQVDLRPVRYLDKLMGKNSNSKSSSSTSDAAISSCHDVLCSSRSAKLSSRKPSRKSPKARYSLAWSRTSPSTAHSSTLAA